MTKVRIPAEVLFAAAMLALMLGLSLAFRLPIRLPATNGALFVGIHYLYPLCGLLICTTCAMFGADRRIDSRPLLVALPCFAVVLFVHFHLKLWAPIINPDSFDATYWQVDETLQPLVEFCFWVRLQLLPFVSYGANLYMWSFIALFWLSLCYHALKTPEIFRTLFLAMLFMQGFGGIAYLLAPAVGPFIYQAGLNPHISQSQHYMLLVHDHVLAQGAPWLSANESAVLLTGLGAMPSLHVGSSGLFLWFAARYGRPLLPAYIPLFSYIVINSIASRWHYLIDLPAGLLLAALSIWLAHRIARPQTISIKAAPAPLPDLVPALEL